MANKKLIESAVAHFMNGDKEVAFEKIRKFFIENAQEINRKLDEEMEDEDCEELDEAEECEDGDDLKEDIQGNMDTDLNQDIQYALGEEEEKPVVDDKHPEEDAEERGDEHPEEDADEDIEHEEEADDLPTGDQWASIKDAFAGLEKLLSGDDVDGDLDLESSDDFGADDEVDLDIDAEDEGDDDFADISFGEEKFGESFKMKPVPAPDKTEKAGVNKKSVLAKNAKSPVEGVEPVKIKDGVVDDTDDKFENKDALPVKTEDMNNVMDNGKNVMKPAKEPKNTAANSRSVLPTKAPRTK